ncbi:hypothetical protein [Sinorhizobium meliloti]
MAQGKLVEHGAAPYEHKEGNSQSYFVTLENAQGERHTTWGVDLERAIAETKPEIGATISLQHQGSEPVRVPHGQTVERHSWKVMDAGEWPTPNSKAVCRDRVKETTLAYAKDFAEQRGIAEAFDVKSEIELAPAKKLSQDITSLLAHPGQDQQDRPERQRVHEARADHVAGPVRGREDPRRQASAVSDRNAAIT